jgi:hypothetical protein
MGASDSIQNLRILSEIAVRAYDALLEKNPWRRPSRAPGPLAAVALVGLGAAIGAGVTLALSPAGGGELRERLRALGKEWLDGLGVERQAAGDDAQGEGGETAASGGETAQPRGRENGAAPAGRRKGTSSGASSAS